MVAQWVVTKSMYSSLLYQSTGSDNFASDQHRNTCMALGARYRAPKESRPVTAATKPKIVLLTISSYMIINMNKDKHSTKF